jgi:hypothetical protein
MLQLRVLLGLLCAVQRAAGTRSLWGPDVAAQLQQLYAQTGRLAAESVRARRDGDDPAGMPVPQSSAAEATFTVREDDDDSANVVESHSGAQKTMDAGRGAPDSEMLAASAEGPQETGCGTENGNEAPHGLRVPKKALQCGLEGIEGITAPTSREGSGRYSVEGGAGILVRTQSAEESLGGSEAGLSAPGQTVGLAEGAATGDAVSPGGTVGTVGTVGANAVGDRPQRQDPALRDAWVSCSRHLKFLLARGRDKAS